MTASRTHKKVVGTESLPRFLGAGRAYAEASVGMTTRMPAETHGLELFGLPAVCGELSPSRADMMEPAMAALDATAAAPPHEFASPDYSDLIGPLGLFAVPTKDQDTVASLSPLLEFPDLSDQGLDLMAEIAKSPTRQPRRPRRAAGAPALVRTPSASELLASLESSEVLQAPKEQWKRCMAQAKIVLDKDKLKELKDKRRRAKGVGYARNSRMRKQEAQKAKDAQIAALQAENSRLRAELRAALQAAQARV